MTNVGSGGPAAPAGAAAGGAAEAPAEAAGEEKKKEEGKVPPWVAWDVSDVLTRSTEKEESDEDMGFGLFD